VIRVNFDCIQSKEKKERKEVNGETASGEIFKEFLIYFIMLVISIK